MRAHLVLLALAAASTLAAQAPAPPKVSRSRFELRVSGFTINGDRSFDFNSTVSNKTGSLKGVDFLLRHKIGGIAFRSFTGDFGETQPHVTSADARLLLFPQAFTLVIGAGRRALWTDLNAASPNQYDVGIVGFSSTMSIGGSGFRTNLSVAAFGPSGKSTDKLKGGLEGEASALYTFPKIPVFLQLGYRTELFTTISRRCSTPSTCTDVEVPEEVRGIRIGGGLQLGGR